MTADPIYKHIGAIIKARRKKLELKQKTLAAKLGISRGALANVEIGRQNVLVHQLYKYAAALDLSPLDLLPPPAGNFKVEQSALPLPADLKALQKEQVTRFYEQVDTGQIRESEGRRAKAAKR